jgi:phosphohistidine phosphatase
VGHCDVEVRSELYLSNRLSLLSHIRAESEETEALVVLAHDPGLHELVIELSGSSPVADIVRSKFPTNALAVFDVSTPWANVDQGANLAEIVIARG